MLSPQNGFMTKRRSKQYFFSKQTNLKGFFTGSFCMYLSQRWSPKCTYSLITFSSCKGIERYVISFSIHSMHLVRFHFWRFDLNIYITEALLKIQITTFFYWENIEASHNWRIFMWFYTLFYNNTFYKNVHDKKWPKN